MGSGGALTQPYQPATPPSALPPSGLKQPGLPRQSLPTRDPFGQTTPRDPFGRLTVPSTTPTDPSTQGLYQRLRPDSLRRNP
jgi:hypothetical protein